MSISDINQQINDKMNKSLSNLKEDLQRIRSGRANPNLLDEVLVSYYGSESPINQVANIVVEDARTLSVIPWDKNMIPVIEKAILKSDLGLNPVAVSDKIRLPLPALTEQTRKNMVKQVKSKGEETRVAIRNIRREANTKLKELLKNKEITEDDDRRAQTSIQKVTDQKIEETEALLKKKETELMEF